MKMPNKLTFSYLLVLLVVNAVSAMSMIGCISSDDEDEIDAIDESEIKDSDRQLPEIDSLIRSSHHILFKYHLSARFPLRGRDMKSSDGRFCQHYQSTQPTDPRFPPFTVKIQLIHNETLLPDEPLESVTFKNDGRVHSHCWPSHDADHVYHFEYNPQPVAYRLKAHGVVYH